MFDAMIHHKIDTEGLEFQVSYQDIETLNQEALKSSPDITKLSTKALSLVLKEYRVLNTGAALGFGVGPLLLAKSPIENWKEKIDQFKIGIPGELTTANFLLDYAFPQKKNKIQMVFSSIEEAIVNHTIDLGLVIHESRFTYSQKGLYSLLDLGSYWEEKTGLPIPLAGIVVRRSLGEEVQWKINRVLRRSIEFAFANPSSSLEYVQSHSQEMEADIVQKHINLYVNDFSLDLGEKGKNAFLILLKTMDENYLENQVFIQD